MNENQHTLQYVIDQAPIVLHQYLVVGAWANSIGLIAALSALALLIYMIRASDEPGFMIFLGVLAIGDIILAVIPVINLFMIIFAPYVYVIQRLTGK